jgi:tripartite motif-containing protein 71
MRKFILFSLIFLTGCVSFTINQVEHESNYRLLISYKNVIGKSGSGAGQYLNPEDVGVDTKGNIYVLDSGTNRILVFDDTLFSHQFGGFGTGTGRLGNPTSFAVSPNYIYVYDAGEGRISKYNLNGDFIGTIFENNNLGRCEIDIDDYGYIYLCSGDGNKIVKISNSGEEILSFGSFGWGEGFLDNPGGIAVTTSGDVYVSDTDNSRVEVFNSQGQFRKEIGKGILKKPIGLELDGWNNLFVCDSEEKKIFVFGIEGGLKEEIKESVGEPYNIAVSGNEKLYVADKKERRVHAFSITRSKFTTIKR